MLSHQLGSPSLQAKISKEDFDKIHSKMNKKELFDEFYECDENYMDSQLYLLKSKNELKFKGEQITGEEEMKIFDKKSKELLESISEAVEILYNEKIFDSNKRNHFLTSSSTL